MDFILMDIKNFLKKLENGQLEIEAGQWELHKDITNMRKVVNELKCVKEELGKVRINSLQQMGLIRELQDRLDNYHTANAKHFHKGGSANGSEGDFKRQQEADGADDEDFSKKKCHFDQSDDVLEVTPQNSKLKSDICNDDSDLRIIGQRGVTEGNEEFSGSCSETSENYPKKQTKSLLEMDEHLPSAHYIPSSTNQDILQRYLQDSAKYLGKQTPGSSEISFRPSDASACENESPVKEFDRSECEGCSSVIPADSDDGHEQPKVKSWKRRSGKVACSRHKPHIKCSHLLLERRRRRRQRLSGTVNCKTCGKDFSSKNRLKKHQVVHWMSSTNAKGFKCSYCKKICPTPQELTQHLKKCRIITRSYHRLKNKNL